MLSFPSIEQIKKEFGEELISEQIYQQKAKSDYELKTTTEVALLQQFKNRGLANNEAEKLFNEFLIREAVYLALHH